MVRKWSYINFNFNESSIDTRCYTLPTKNKHVFKVFRKNTRFKKWSVGLTKSVRKKYLRRKHLFNNLVLSYISKYWVNYYLNYRSFNLFYHNLRVFNTVFLTNSTPVVLNFLNKELLSFNQNYGFNFLSLNSLYVKSFLLKTRVKSINSFDISYFQNNGQLKGLNAYSRNNDFKDLNISSSLVYNNWNGEIKTLPISKNSNRNIENQLYQIKYTLNTDSLIINHVSKIYSILILLSLLNTFKP